MFRQDPSDGISCGASFFFPSLTSTTWHYPEFGELWGDSWIYPDPNIPHIKKSLYQPYILSVFMG